MPARLDAIGGWRADSRRAGPVTVKASHAAADVAGVNRLLLALLARARRLAAATACAALCSVALSVAHLPGARADTIDQAKQQAAQIAAEIAKLQPQVDQAMADYDTALDSVGQTVTTSVAAQRTYNALQARADAATTAQNSHIVALYESGGSVVLYAAILQTGDPNGLHQVPMLSGVVAADAAAAANATRVAQAAKQRSDVAANQIATSLADADVVDQRLANLQNLLAQQQTLLDQASAKASQLQALQDAAAAVAAARAAVAQAGATVAADVTPSPIPANFAALYQAAAQTCPGLSWTVLAAIGQVETHHGQGSMVSSAGALGPMQFMPATFVHYAVDGDHDGKADIMDPADAIFTAAHYLCANGAGNGGDNLRTAIWNYNHADWYVQLVLALSAKIG
jgi:Transglycosylase SLT domain